MGEHHLLVLEFTEGVLKIRELSLSFSDLCFIAPKDIGIGGGLAKKVGGFQNLAFGLDALVDVLDLLVDVRRLSIRG